VPFCLRSFFFFFFSLVKVIEDGHCCSDSFSQGGRGHDIAGNVVVLLGFPFFFF